MSDIVLDSGPLEALTPDEDGVLREWSMKYAIISEPQTDNSTLSIFSSSYEVLDSEAEVDIAINDCEVQISKEPSFERCFTLTANGLKVFLRAANVAERDAWVHSIRCATKPIPPPTMPPPPLHTVENDAPQQLEATTEEGIVPLLRTCGYVYVWEDGTQTWTDLVFLYLSAGYLHEFRTPFSALPTRTHDLTANCAIRVRGTPPCIEMKLGSSESILRFYGRVEQETQQWLHAIKARALEPPQRYIDASVAAFDAYTVEQNLAKSFFIQTGTLNTLLAGTASTFPVMSTTNVALQYSDFTAKLTQSIDSSAQLCQGTFHQVDDGHLLLHVAYSKQGKYFLHIKFRGEHVFESPFPVVVHATSPSAPHSVVSGRGIIYAPLHVGKLAKFVVTLRDRYLNLCSSTLDAKRLQVECFGPSKLAHIKYVGDGSFEVAYTVANTSSEVSIEVAYAGIPVAGSPFFPVFGDEDDDEPQQQQQQQQSLRVQQPVQQDQATLDLSMARKITLQSEAMSSFLSSKLRREWAHGTPVNDDESFSQQEQLEMMMQSSALRTNPRAATESAIQEPEFLRSFAVELSSSSKWEPEPIPPPWASISLVTAQARRARRDLQECIEPLVEATRQELETSMHMEPKPAWKRMLLDWKGAEKCTLQDIEHFKREISSSPLEHRQLICAMCDAICRIEDDLDVRRKAKRQENGGLLIINDEEEEDEKQQQQLITAAAAANKVNPREELRKRVQSLALGVKPNMLQPVRPVQEMDYSSAVEEQQQEVSAMPLLENDEEEEEHKFQVGDLVLVDGTKIGVIRHLGPTSFAEGEWVGLELNAAEGKNNGIVNGRKYFTCKPDHGLFVRVDRLTMLPNNAGAVESPKLLDPSTFDYHNDKEEAEDGWAEENQRWKEERRAAHNSPRHQQHEEEEEDSHQWNHDEDYDAHPYNEDDDDDEDFFAPSPPTTPQRQQQPQQLIQLSPGSLQHADARDIAATLKSRVNSRGKLTREGLVSSIKRWEPRADPQQLISFFDSLLSFSSSEIVDPVELNPFLVCLCNTALQNRSAAFYLLDLNRSGYLERAEVDRFACAVFTVMGQGRDPKALAKQVTDSAMRRFSALGTSLSFEEFDMWIQNNPVMAGGLAQQRGVEVSTSPVLPPVTPIQYIENEEDDGDAEDKWVMVQRWLEEEVGVTQTFEKRAAFDAFKEANYCSFDAVAQLTAREINRLNLSFDLRLRLITKVRALAKSRRQPSNVPRLTQFATPQHPLGY